MSRKLRAAQDGDTRLMLRVGNGDSEAFITLYKKYFQPVTNFFASSNGHVSSLEDLVQTVFVRIWTNRGNFRGDSTFKTYLFGVARNVLLEENRRIRRHKAQNDRPCPVDHFSPNELSQPESDAHSAEVVKALSRAIFDLPPDQRQCVKQVYYQGMSYQQAAEVSNMYCGGGSKSSPPCPLIARPVLAPPISDEAVILPRGLET